MEIIKILSILFFLCLPSSLVASQISITPMFVQIAKGGVGELSVINNTEQAKKITVTVFDQMGLKSKWCTSVRHINLKSHEVVKVGIHCLKNREKGMHFVVLDYSEFELRELRRIVVY